MRKAVAGVLFLSAALLGADFWEKKKADQWSEKEVEKILEDSPWSQKVSVGTGDLRVGDTGSRGARVASTGPGGRDSIETLGGGGRSASIEIGVRWESALPVRQALARTKDAAEAQPPPDSMYVLLVGPVPPDMIGDKPEAFLAIRKESLPARQIRGERAGRGANLRLLYPRDRAISLDDSEVEVVLKLKEVTIKRKFKLKDMVYEGKLEL